MQSPAQLRLHDTELSSLGIVRMWTEELVGHQPDGTAAEPLPECAVDDLSRAALDAAADQEGEGSPGCSGSTESSESSLSRSSSMTN